MTEHRLRPLFDWAAAQDNPRRLALWIAVALALHAGAYALFRIRYPAPAPPRIAEAAIYVLQPGSPEAKRLAPFLAGADPALFAPERANSGALPAPTAPPYQPSYATAALQLTPLPEKQDHTLPPLLRDFGPVPVREESRPAPTPLPTPARGTQLLFSPGLQARAPATLPPFQFQARPGDWLAPMRFLLAVAPDGRVLHTILDDAAPNKLAATENQALEDTAARYLTGLVFRAQPGTAATWGTATFHWGLDVERKELR
jgi:hypothetical protein